MGKRVESGWKVGGKWEESGRKVGGKWEESGWEREASSDLSGDGTAAPSSVETVRLALDLDVGAAAVDRVRRRKVVESHQQMEIVLRLSHHPPFNAIAMQISGQRP